MADELNLLSKLLFLRTRAFRLLKRVSERIADIDYPLNVDDVIALASAATIAPCMLLLIPPSHHRHQLWRLSARVLAHDGWGEVGCQILPQTLRGIHLFPPLVTITEKSPFP